MSDFASTEASAVTAVFTSRRFWLVVVAIAIGLLPTTGVDLPFVSAGGTNLVLALAATGILINIAKQRRC